MDYFASFSSRRGFLRGGVALGVAALSFTPGVLAKKLAHSPRMTEGPFYPDQLSHAWDNDLLIVSDSLTPAVGQLTHLSGRILDSGGRPVRNAEIEIWQCDANQVYINSRDSGPKAAQRDRNFQGFGRFTTGSTGEYRFRTIKPVPYTGRPAPHIHYKVKISGWEVLTSQIFRPFPGERAGRGVPDGAGPGGSRADPGEFRAGQGIEGRRAGGAV